MDAGHHMGGLGMGKDNNSLINKNLKVKKSNGTYVTGGAIFNFNDSINPSLSYIALSIYLSDQLYKRK
jgi:choline dehydrogenase-like flavoprotein